MNRNSAALLAAYTLAFTFPGAGFVPSIVVPLPGGTLRRFGGKRGWERRVRLRKAACTKQGRKYRSGRKP